MTEPDGNGDFLQEKARIGSDSEPGFVLGNPSAITVDRRGHVYVADMASMTVKVFDGAGRPLRRFGARGRGPRQFLAIGPMSLVGPDELAIVDNTRGALSSWSTDGDFLGELTLPEDAQHVSQLKPWGPDSLLLLYNSITATSAPQLDPNARGLLFHQASRASLELEAEFGSAELSLNQQPDAGAPLPVLAEHGIVHSSRQCPDRVLAPPTTKAASICSDRKVGTVRGVSAASLPGTNPPDPLFSTWGLRRVRRRRCPYRSLQWKEAPRHRRAIFHRKWRSPSIPRSGFTRYEAVHRSLGLFSTRAGSLVQFLRVRLDQGGDAILMQTFSPDGELLHCQQSELLTREMLDDGLDHAVLAMDGRRQVYVVSRTPDWRVPTVRVFEVRLESDHV